MRTSIISMMLALSPPMLAHCGGCPAPHGTTQSAESSGAATIVFDSTALATSSQLASVDQGTLNVVDFGVVSMAEIGGNYTTFGGGDRQVQHYLLRLPTRDDVMVWFRLGDQTILSCATTLTKLSVGSSALADLCDTAGLSLGESGQQNVVIPIWEGPQGAADTLNSGPEDSLGMVGAFTVYVDLRNVPGTVTSTVALDDVGNGSVTIDLSIPQTTTAAWFTGSSNVVTTAGSGTVELTATLHGIETLSDGSASCPRSPPSYWY